ncbi:MAG TPA: S9 family peptidase [Candidatus Baltobacteraceae bacterium]
MLRAAALLATLALLPVAAAASTFSLNDAYRLVGYSAPRFSPDGTRLLFTRSRVDLETDRHDTELVVLGVADGVARVLTQDRTAVSAPTWSPRGDRMAFVAPDDQHHNQIWILPVAGGEAQRATSAPQGVAQYAWRPDGGAIAFVTADEPPKKTGVARFEDSYRVTDNAFTSVGPFRSSHLWLATASGDDGRETWTSRRLTSGSWHVSGSTISWSPDGATLAYVRTPTSIPGDGSESTVQLLDVAGGTSRALTDHARYEWDPRFAPSGATIAYAWARDGDPNSESDVFVSGGRGAGRDLSIGIDRNAANYAWYPDGRALLLEGNDATHKTLWRLDLAGHATKIDVGDMDVFGDFDGSIARDGAIAFVGATPNHPGEIYYLAAGSKTPRQLTHDNDWIAQRSLGRVRTVDWTGPDGFAEDGVLTYPPSFDPHERYPLVLEIHGGPTEATTTSFDAFTQTIAAHGYIVFQPNYRGSDNLGNAYERAVYRDPVIGPDKDIMAGIAAVKAHDPIDASRVCVSGWSYGGLMTSWLITHHDWRCAISGAAVDDQVLDTVLADDINVNEYSMWGPPFATEESLDAYRAASPITYYRNVHTPTLILDDTFDARVPEPESYAFFHALQDAGKTVEFYQWPIAAHFPGDPIRRNDVYRMWLGWLDKYLR